MSNYETTENRFQKFNDITPLMYFSKLTPSELREWRIKLGLTQKEIASVIGVSSVTISNIENEKVTNPWAVQLYNIILERYYAAINGYVPAYRKVGTNTFVNEIGEKNELRI